jgi:hypothetical protein
MAYTSLPQENNKEKKDNRRILLDEKKGAIGAIGRFLLFLQPLCAM